jgi:regulator of RNase E activity RraA
MSEIKKPSAKVIESFHKLSSPVISDAMDKLGIKGGCHGIKPVVPGQKIVGPAFTVKYRAADENPGTVGDYIDQVEEGEIVVLDNRGRTDCTVWGDILTFTSVQKKIKGTVIDGVCRDVDGLKELNYSIFSRGYYMVTGKDRVEVESVNEPVVVADVKVEPGDIIFADDSGVLVIPRERAEEILELAEQIALKEERIIEEIKNGKTIAQAREKYGYHKLQRKQQ